MPRQWPVSPRDTVLFRLLMDLERLREPDGLGPKVTLYRRFVYSDTEDAEEDAEEEDEADDYAGSSNDAECSGDA